MKGVHAAIVTHFSADLTVDHDAVAGEVNRLLIEGVHGIVPNRTGAPRYARAFPRRQPSRRRSTPAMPRARARTGR